MTARWIAASLAVMALAACHKKDEAKPPPPKPDAPTTATTTTPPTTTTPAPEPETPPVTSTIPAAEEPAVTPPPPPAGVTPTTTPDAPPTFIPLKPPPPIKVKRPPIKIIQPKPTPKVVVTKAQLNAQRQVVGTWIEQKNRKSVLSFTADGKVVAKQGTPTTWTGEWKADANGAIQFTLTYNNPTNPLTLTAYPTPAKIMAVIPHWGDSFPGQGQYAYERMH